MRRNTRRKETRNKDKYQDLDFSTWCITALDGTRDIVCAELERKLGSKILINEHPRPNEVHFHYNGDVSNLLKIRTAQSLFVRRDEKINRPRTLLSPERMFALVDWIKAVQGLCKKRWSGFRIDAAGAGSPTMVRIAKEIEAALDLPFLKKEGDCVLAMRPGETGWEILCRVGIRPLATRDWRKVNYPGSLNAAIAACMIEMTQPCLNDRLINLMCGGGTLLIERLLRGPVKCVVGVDRDLKAIEATRSNVSGAGLSEQVMLFIGDTQSCGLFDANFNTILVDLPYGATHGEIESNRRLYYRVLKEMSRLCVVGGKAVLITEDRNALNTALTSLTKCWRIDEQRPIVQRQYRPLCVRLQRI